MSGALSRIREELLYSTVVYDDKGHVQKQIDEDNRKTAVIWSVVEIVFWIVCLILSFNDEIFARTRVMFASALVLSSATLVLSLFVAPKQPKLIRVIIFVNYAVLLFAGIGISFFQTDVRSATFIAAALIVPVMFVSDTLLTIMCLALSIIIFAITGPNVLEPDIYSWTFKSLLIFSAVGVIIGHIINKTRFERYAFEESALELAELRNRFAYFDQMTELPNRRAYSDRIGQLIEDMPSSCCAISADINGLKQVNDTYGHSAGDELIVGAANCLRQCFEDVGDIYRLGGDEFCVITTASEKDVMERLARLEQATANWKGQLVDNLSISYGIAIAQEDEDIESVLKTADRKMYEFKRNYYMTSGRERRRRPDESPTVRAANTSPTANANTAMKPAV